MTVSAVILAAGLSSRMGKQNKLLAQICGQPLIRRVVDVVAQVTDTPPLVVLGHEAMQVADALAGAPARLMTNPDYLEGQQSSASFGMRWVDPADLTLMALGDQPRLTVADLTDLLDAHRMQANGRITVPVRPRPDTRETQRLEDGERGNPIVLPDARLREVRAQGQNLACGRFTRRNPEAVHAWPTSRPGFFEDVDVPAELAAAQDALALQQAL
ncbi:MAG: nucleotidyltransferase family protein [Pseudomonadota bacterium]